MQLQRQSENPTSQQEYLTGSFMLNRSDARCLHATHSDSEHEFDLDLSFDT